MPARRGVLVTPTEFGWMMQHYLADLTSRSLRGEIRRGTFIVPDEVTWIIKRYSPDPTSGSLRKADLTSKSLQADATSASL